MLLNDVRKEAQQIKALQQPVLKTKEELSDELDEIELLMDKLKKVSSRTERRRLLAKFNRKQAMQMGSKAPFGTQNYALMNLDTELNKLEVIQEDDENLVWNPAVKGYVDKKLYLQAIETKDPTARGYRGVSPNFGGGKIEFDMSIGQTPQKMKKLTTVLSKNQKLNSFNVPLVTKKFERKSNLANEVHRQEMRELQTAK